MKIKLTVLISIEIRNKKLTERLFINICRCVNYYSLSNCNEW